MSWSATVAIFVFLLALGKFIDDFHAANPGDPRDNLRLRTQTLLRQTFEVIYRVPIPDIPMQLCKVIFATNRKMSIRLVAWIATAYFATVGVVWLLVGAAMRWSKPADVPLVDFFYLVILSTILFTVISLPVGRFFISRLQRRPPLFQRVFLPFVIVAMTLVDFTFFAILLEINRAIHGFPTAPLHLTLTTKALIVGFLFLFICLLLEPTLLILAAVVFLSCIFIILEVIRWLLLVISKGASDPNKSPFSYFFGFFGVVILLLKAIQEIAKG